MKILFSTSNAHKIQEVKAMFEEKKLDIELLSLKDMEKKYDEPIEDGNTFLDNAIIKAKYYYEKYQMPIITDDSGLEVDALNGMPGVLSARYASTNNHNASSSDNRKKLLKELEKVSERSAHFTCVVVYFDGVNMVSSTGYVNGIIATKETGDKGFGYDCLFYLPSFNKTMAELVESDKNKVSHRGRAITGLLDVLTKKQIIFS